MIIIKILGGLGNQLFQYIFYKYISENTPNVKVDISDFLNYRLHNGLEIENFFEIEWQVATENEIEKVKDHSKTFISKFRRVILKRYRKSHILEKDFNYALLNSDLDLYLDGYWQNEEIFRRYYSSINQWIKLKTLTLNENNQQAFDKINQTLSVGIHLRRGDYLSSKNQKIYYNCSLNYYLEAVDIFKKQNRTFSFFIFSDDIEWTKQNLKIEQATYIDFNKGENSLYDFYLLCHCKNLIIANSTYSWWASTINEKSKEIVIAPKYWRKDISNPIYLPDNWNILNNI